jgi:3-dehydroquinate dehydratase
VHGTPQGAGAFAVHDTHLQDAASPALLQVVGYQLVNVAGMEGVQVESAVDGHFDGVIVDFGIVCGGVVHPLTP